MLDKVKLKTINNNSLIGDGNISVGGSDIVTSWGDTLSDTKVPSEKLAKNTIDLKVNIAQGSTNKNKNVVTDNSGNITIEAKPTIPSKVSDLTNDSGFITSSSLPTKVSDLQNDTGFITSSSLPTKTSDLTNDGDGTNVFIKNNDSRLTDSRTPTSHTHGNLTNDGKVGSTANYFVYTTTSGAITSKQKIGNITTSGAIGSTSGLPIITTSSGVLTTGSFGTGSGTFAEGNHTHSNYINTSSTTGLVKNDGSIMTSGTGSSNYSAGNHTHSGYVSATKVTSWQSTPSDSNVPSEKLVKDYIDNQIGLAIQYIQQ